MRQGLFLVLLAAVLCLGVVSCGEEPMEAEICLETLQAACGTLPEGEIYRKGAQEGGKDYLSPSLMNAMYGEDAAERFSLVEDYAIYLSSFAAPYEIAVLRAYSASDASELVTMCLNRADTVCVALRQTEFRDLCDQIRVLRRGRFVIMGLVEDGEAFEREVLRLL